MMPDFESGESSETSAFVSIGKGDLKKYLTPEKKEVEKSDTLADYVEKPGTDYFQTRLEEIRKLRHEDRGAAREAVVRIKHELAETCDLQARAVGLQVKFLNAMNANPDMSLSELRPAFDTDRLSATEQALLERAHRELAERRKVTVGVLKYARERAQKRVGLQGNIEDEEYRSRVELEAGNVLYEAFTGKKPMDKVRIEESNFAVGLDLDGLEDYKVLRGNPGEEAGGVYIDGKEVAAVAFVKTPRLAIASGNGVPVIATQRLAQSTTFEHERNHGINKAISESLFKSRGREHAAVWGAATLHVVESANLGDARVAVRAAIAKFDQGKATPEQVTLEVRRAMGMVVNEALASAKNELVADFVADEHLEHVDNLCLSVFAKGAPADLYNYFGDIGFHKGAFASPPELRRVYNELVKEYNGILARAIDEANRQWKLFEKLGMKAEKKEEFTALLRQSPLSTWNERVATFYSEENKQLVPLFEKGQACDAIVDGVLSGYYVAQDDVKRLGDERHAWLRNGNKLNDDRQGELVARYEEAYRQIDDLKRTYRQDTVNIVYDANALRTIQVDDLKARAAQLQLQLEEVGGAARRQADFAREQVANEITNHKFWQFTGKVDRGEETVIALGGPSSDEVYAATQDRFAALLEMSPEQSVRQEARFGDAAGYLTGRIWGSNKDLEGFKNQYPDHAGFIDDELLPRFEAIQRLDRETADLDRQQRDLATKLRESLCDEAKKQRPSQYNRGQPVWLKNHMDETWMVDRMDKEYENLNPGERRMVDDIDQVQAEIAQKRKDLVALHNESAQLAREFAKRTS